MVNTQLASALLDVVEKYFGKGLPSGTGHNVRRWSGRLHIHRISLPARFESATIGKVVKGPRAGKGLLVWKNPEVTE